MVSTSPPPDRQWHIVSRWQEYEGEARANLLRIAAIGCFYAVELLNYYGFRVGGTVVWPAIEIEKTFHQAMTAIALAWAFTGLAILLLQKNHIFPAAVKYGSTAADLVFLTLVLMLASGPQSPLVAAYFLVVAIAALRFSLGLVRFATAGAVAGYLVVLGQARWFVDPPRTVPRHHQIIVILALGLTGVVLGQIVRRAQHMAEEYAARRAAGKEQLP